MTALENDYRDDDGKPISPGRGVKHKLPKYLNPINMMATSKARGNGRPDASARRHARSDGQAVGRNHRDADQVELPRRPVACSSTSARPTAPVRAWPTPP